MSETKKYRRKRQLVYQDNNGRDKSTTSLFKDTRSIPLLLPRIKQTTTTCPPVLLTEKIVRKRRLPIGQRKELRSNYKQLQDADMEKWLGRFPEAQWRIKEKRALKVWFDKLDTDQSGEIDVEELADPLLSTGLAKNMSEVRSLIRRVDEDRSNGIGFQEFLTVMKSNKETTNKRVFKSQGSKKGKVDEQISRVKRIKRQTDSTTEKWTKVMDLADYGRKPKAKKKKKKPLNPIVQLSERRQNDAMDMSSSLCLERRKLLLDATMGESERRQRAFTKVQRWRNEMKGMKGAAKFKKLRDISKVVQQMEVNQAEKENVVQAMKGVLSRALESSPDSDVIRAQAVTKTAAQKESIRRRNVLMLTRDTRKIGQNGGRHALVLPRTRTPSLPTILSIDFSKRKNTLL